MLVIGLTGSLATGKSTVAAFFKKNGAIVLSADRMSHELIEPGGKCFEPVLNTFGPDILRNGRIDRRRLAAIVFKDTSKRRKLEKIIHPEVVKRTLEIVNRYKATEKRIVLEVPLLFEAKWHDIMDVTVVVVASEEAQIKRAKRSGMTKAEALARIKAQMPLRKKIRMADFIIDNNETKKQTEKQVNALCQKL